MNDDFYSWVKLNGRYLSKIGAALAAIQGAIASLLAFPNLLEKLSHALPSTSHLLQAAFTAVALGFMISQGYKEEENTQRRISLNMLVTLWIGILCCWTFFYLILVCQDMQLQLPKSIFTGWIPNLINRVPTLLAFAMYLIMCDRWNMPSTRVAALVLVATCLFFTLLDAGIQQKAQDNDDQIAKYGAGISTTLLGSSASSPIPLDLQQKKHDFELASKRLLLFSSSIDFLVWGMFVSRLDSKIFSMPPIVLWILYLFAPLQLLISTQDREFTQSLMAITFIVKSVLILTVIWLFDTAGMSLFLRRVRELGDAAPAEIANANSRAQSRKWSYAGGVAGD